MVLTILVVAVIITFLYDYTLINQLEYVIVGSFVFPYLAANYDRTHPWMLNIRNTLSDVLRAVQKLR